MIIKGKARGNGRQLAEYLVDMKDNDKIEIFTVVGTTNPDNFKGSIVEMDDYQLLTKSDKGMYHGQICPEKDLSLTMTDDEWLKCIQVNMQELGMEKQPWAAVKHFKQDGCHMHLVVQRYDVEKNKMVSDSKNYEAHNRARERLEVELGHNRTPQYNKRRPELMRDAMDAWQSTNTGEAFVNRMKTFGYTISRSNTRRPFQVIDVDGRSFDLTRKLKDRETKTYIPAKDVWKRLGDMELPTDKSIMRSVQVEKKKKANTKTITEKTALEQEREEFLKKLQRLDRDKGRER